MSSVNTSVLKALDILDLLGRAARARPLKDIACALDLPESTTHRLLASLAERGYVRQRESNGAYSLGWKVVTLARTLGAEARLAQDVRPRLEALVRQVGCTVNLGVLNDRQVLYLDCLVPDHTMSVYVAPGTVFPAYATALGKSLLAHLPAPELEAALSGLQLEPLTPRTVTTMPALRATLAGVRRRGYAVDRGEMKPDLTCIAAPVTDASGRPVAAISATARTAEVAPEWEEETAAAVLAAARDSARRFCGP